MNNETTKIKLRELFRQFSDVDENDCSVLYFKSSEIYHSNLLEHSLDEVPNNIRALIVLVDTSDLSIYSRIVESCRRRLTVRHIATNLRRRDYTVGKDYLLYPSISRVTLVYESNSAAAKYAESMMISKPRGRLTSLINQAMLQLGIRSPSVELFAVAGRRL